MKQFERLGRQEQAVIEKRRSTGYHVDELRHFKGDREATLRALLGRLLPGVLPSIDLAGFIDSHTGMPMGRGDRRVGLAPERELFVEGVGRLAQAGFAHLSADEQRALIGRMRSGDAEAELGFAAKDFIDRLLDKAVAGYLAHPDVWERIGFTGPAFPEGYAWIGNAEVAARKKKAAGWKSL